MLHLTPYSGQAETFVNVDILILNSAQMED